MKAQSMNTKSRQFLKLSVAALTVMAALILGAPTAATAQTTTQLSGSTQQSVRPQGSWLYTVTIPGFTFQGIETYSAGGGYTEADQLSFNPLAVASAGHGAWQMTGARTFNLTYLNLTFDGFSTGNPTGTLRCARLPQLVRVETLTPAQATTPTTIWTAIPFPASVGRSPSRPRGLSCRPHSNPPEYRQIITGSRSWLPVFASFFWMASLDCWFRESCHWF